MFEKKYPSKRYFELVKTKEDYSLFIKSGMAWEVEPNLPNNWEEHLGLLESIAKFKACGWHERACNCPSFVSLSAKRFYSQKDAIIDSLTFNLENNRQ